MVSAVVVMLNVMSTLIGLFCLGVTIRLWRKHRLNRTLFFVGTGFFFTLWNLLHLINNFVTEESTARSVFTFGFLSGFLFVACALFGFSMMRRNEITWELVIYSVFLTSYFTYYVAKPEVMGLIHTEEEGWFSTASNPYFWNSFTVFLVLANIYELMIPLYQTRMHASEEYKPKVTILIISIAVATFSSGMLQLLAVFKLPNVSRFVVPGLGFFVFFYYLNRYPFLGFHDGSRIHEVLITDSAGLPIYSPLSIEGRNYLNSGAILGVSAMFDEISRWAGVDIGKHTERFRRIELEANEFFIASIRDFQVIFNFSDPSAITLQKMKSLARIFWKREDETELIKRFDQELRLFFPSLELPN